jgi:hypothetical protein
MPINKRRLQVLIAAPITVIAAAYGVYWLVPNVREFAREQEQQSAYAACINGIPSRGGIAYGPKPAEAKRTGELPCSRSWSDPWHAPVEHSYLLDFVKKQARTMLAYLSVGLIGPWLLGAFLVRTLPWGFGRVRGWLTTADGGSGAVATSAATAAPAPRTDREGRPVFSDLRLRHTARWVAGICALLLIILPVLAGRPLFIGIYLASEPLGFAGLVFGLTFWAIPGSPAERRSARREAYAALLYVLAALDALVFHLVL